MINIYQYWTRRNKGKISALNSKKQLYNGFCDKCKKEFQIGDLQLEHQIPIALAGKIFDLSNQKLYCNDCHRAKTKIDLEVIHLMKRLKILRGSGFRYDSLAPIPKLHKYYFYFFRLVKEFSEKSRVHSWDFDEINRINYLENEQ